MSSNPEICDEREARQISATRRDILAGASGVGLAAGLAGTASAQSTSVTREFAGKTAFVTGAARGIGLACAEALAKGGANIVLLDIAKQLPDVPYPLATKQDLMNAKTSIEKSPQKQV